MVSECGKKMLKNGVRLALAFSLMAGFMPFAAGAATSATAAPVVAPAAEAMPQAEPQEKGNADIGRQIFTGERGLTNGGPPCISCHSANVGELGGGLVGPNLTKVYADPSKNPLLSDAWINNPSTPVMGPVFSNKNITEEEVGHLRAFFQRQSKETPAVTGGGPFVIIGIAGTIGILIIFSIIWSGRYRNRNGGTAHDALWRNYGGKGGR